MAWEQKEGPEQARKAWEGGELTVREAAELSGVSVRTLHYYDEIGLLRPARVTEAGYRLYGGEELARLQQILLYRELDFSLAEIRDLLSPGEADRREEARRDALKKQRALLEMKRARLDRLISLTGRLLKGEPEMDFEAFDTTQIEEQKQKYAEEVKERWGGTEAYRESERRTAAYEKEDWARIQQEMDEIFRSFADCMELGPASPQAQALVREWQEFITANFYPCPKEVLAGLGQMYSADERFQKTFAKTAPGLGGFIAAAIEAYCA